MRLFIFSFKVSENNNLRSTAQVGCQQRALFSIDRRRRKERRRERASAKVIEMVTNIKMINCYASTIKCVLGRPFFGKRLHNKFSNVRILYIHYKWCKWQTDDDAISIKVFDTSFNRKIKLFKEQVIVACICESAPGWYNCSIFNALWSLSHEAKE